MSAPRCLVVGRGLIGSAIVLDDFQVVRVGHRDALKAIASERPKLLINAALDPAILIVDEAAEESLDAQYAAQMPEDCRYVMLSSRKVYGTDRQWAALEAHTGTPATAYGRNKLAAETLVSRMLGDRALVLRLPNVYGLELNTQRPTFFGLMLASLRVRDEIVLQFASETERDFLLVGDCVTMMSRLIATRGSGTFNLGYGRPIACGEIAAALTRGYNGGKVINSCDERLDEFYLKTTRLASHICVGGLIGNRRGAFEIGQRLREHAHSDGNRG